MAAGEQRRHVVNEAYPFDGALLVPRLELGLTDGCRVGGVGKAGKDDVDGDAARLEYPRRLDQHAGALRPQHARYEGKAGAPFGLRRRGEAGDIDPRSPDQHHLLRLDDAGADEGIAVVRVLDDHPACRAVEEETEGEAVQEPEDARLGAVAGEDVTEARKRVDHSGNPRHQGGDGAEHHRLHRHVMDDVGALGAIEPDDRNEGRKLAPGIGKPSWEIQRNEGEPSPLDLIPVILHAGRHHHLQARVPRRPRDRQAVGAEIPVLGHQVEDLGFISHFSSA